MTKKARFTDARSFSLGDRVRVKELAGWVGRVTELRGPLGPGGAQVYRVRLNKKPRGTHLELLGDQLEPLPASGAASDRGRRKSSPPEAAASAPENHGGGRGVRPHSDS